MIITAWHYNQSYVISDERKWNNCFIIFDKLLKKQILVCYGWILSGAYEQQHATPLYFCQGVFIDRFIFRPNLLWMRLPRECHNQSQHTNWRHCATGPELHFFHKRKGVLKIDQSVKMPWHRLSMGVASSCSSAPDFVELYVHNIHKNHLVTLTLSIEADNRGRTRRNIQGYKLNSRCTMCSCSQQQT